MKTSKETEERKERTDEEAKNRHVSISDKSKMAQKNFTKSKKPGQWKLHEIEAKMGTKQPGNRTEG